MSEEEAQELLLLLQKDQETETFRSFIHRVTPKLPPPPHLDPIIDLIQRSLYEEVQATVSLPPRHAKTTTGVNGLAWRTLVDPTKKNVFASASADFAQSKSRETRNLALEAGTQLDPKAQAVEEWLTTGGGGLIAKGVGGQLTGRGITGMAWVDDTVKGREDADSGAARNKIWDWFNEVVITRREPGSSCIVVATRWHPDDLIGRLHSPDYQHTTWENINLPAVRDKDGKPADERILDEHGRVVPGVFRDDVYALWPEQYPLERLAQIRAQIGEYSWWSLYQGVPVPRGASIFTSAPSRFSLKDFKLDGHRVIISLDPAATASVRADYSVAVVMAAKGFGEDAEYWVLDRQKWQITIPELVREVRRIQAEWRVPVAVEAVGAFKAIPQMLKEADPGMVLFPVEMRGDKFARSQPYAAAWNNYRVHVPTDTDWCEDYIYEHSSFTGVNDKRDDQVDAGAHAFTALARMSPKRRNRDYSFVDPF